MKMTTNSMNGGTGRTIRRLTAACGLLAMLLTCGCFGGGEVSPPKTPGSGPSGKVIQGPVDGATVFADRLVANGLGDMIIDSSETAYRTTTGSFGQYILPSAPPYPYLIVSKGGNDTLSGQPAIMLFAPARAQNVSALTTMVTLDPALQAKIETLLGGASYDTDISQTVTPSALMLAKTIESAVQGLTKTLNPGGNTISTTQVTDIQLTLLTNLAAQISLLSATELASPAFLQAAVATAVTVTTTTIDSRYTNMSISNPVAIGSNIAAIVPIIANVISGSSTTSLLTNPSSAEAVLLPLVKQNIITAAVNTAVSQNAGLVSVVSTTIGDTTAPTVTATTPVSGANGVALNSGITVVFSEPLDLTTVTLANFSVSGATGGAVRWNNTSNSVIFTGMLPASTVVIVTISGMKDLAGNAMATMTWSFTTAAAPDTLNPTIISTTPAASATGVNSSTVTAVFSEAMDPATMSGATFSLTDNSSGLLVSGAVSYDIATRTISFTPTAKLLVATVYSATISTAAKDLSGNPLSAAASWSFTTTNTGSSTTVANF